MHFILDLVVTETSETFAASFHESDKLLSGPGQSLMSSRHKEEAAFLLPTTCLL